MIFAHGSALQPSTSSRAKSAAVWGEVKQGDPKCDACARQTVLPLARGATGLQVASSVFLRGLFQPVGKGRARGDGEAGTGGADRRTGEARHRHNARQQCNPASRPRPSALIAFTLLTGARDSAIASLKLKHVNLAAGCVEQDAREVRTKFSKTFTTFFFPVGEEIRRIVAEWVAYLREDMLWGNDDPLFPATRIALGDSRQFEAVGLERVHWSTAARIRTTFRNAFFSADLPYFNPHSFRNTLVRLGQVICQTPEEFKAWSQNLGHDKVLTTFLSYGQVESLRQGEIIRGLATPQLGTPLDVIELAKALVREMQDSEIRMLVH